MANTISDYFRSITLGGSSSNSIYLNNFLDSEFGHAPNVWDDYVDRNYRETYPNMAPSTDLWDNGSLGNFWSDYNGTDTNGDGVGDTPYILRSAPSHGVLDLIYGQDNFPLMSQVSIASVTIELPDWTINLPPEPQTINPQIQEPTTPAPNLSPESQIQTEQQPISPEPYSSLIVIIVSAASSSVCLCGRVHLFEETQANISTWKSIEQQSNNLQPKEQKFFGISRERCA